MSADIIKTRKENPLVIEKRDVPTLRRSSRWFGYPGFGPEYAVAVQLEE